MILRHIFLHVALHDLKKIHEQIWVPEHRGTELGCQRMFLEQYDVTIELLLSSFCTGSSHGG